MLKCCLSSGVDIAYKKPVTASSIYSTALNYAPRYATNGEVIHITDPEHIHKKKTIR